MMWWSEAVLGTGVIKIRVFSSGTCEEGVQQSCHPGLAGGKGVQDDFSRKKSWRCRSRPSSVLKHKPVVEETKLTEQRALAGTQG